MAGWGGISPPAASCCWTAPSAAVAVPAPENAPAMVPVSNPRARPTNSPDPAIASTASNETTTGRHPVRMAPMKAGPAAMPTM